MASRSPQVVTGQDWGHRPKVIIPHFKWLLQEEDTRARAALWDISDDERHQLRHLLLFQLQPQPAPHFTWHFGVMAGVSQATCTCKRVSRQHKINTSPFPHMASICPPAVPASPVPELLSHQGKPKGSALFHSQPTPHISTVSPRQHKGWPITRLSFSL